MSGFRAYFNFSENGAECAEGADVELSADESRHLCGSLRAVEADTVDLFDLSGNARRCRIVKASQKKCVVRLGPRLEAEEDKAKVYVAQCVPKGKVFDDIIRQSVEVGAAGVIPLLSRRSVFRADAGEAQKKCLKWEAHVVEEVKQSANFSKFEMRAPLGIEAFFEAGGEFDFKFIASLQDGAEPVLSALESRVCGAEFCGKVCLLVGPEGDFCAEEYAEASRRGYVPVCLGRNVMKCDTAALCFLSAAKAFFNAARARKATEH